MCRVVLSTVDFLTGIGHMYDDKRQKFILLSGTLGMLVDTIVGTRRRVHDVCTERPKKTLREPIE